MPDGPYDDERAARAELEAKAITLPGAVHIIATHRAVGGIQPIIPCMSRLGPSSRPR